MDKLSSEFDSVKDQISKTQKRTRTDEKSIQYGNKRNKLMDNTNNNNRNDGNVNEKCETAENNNTTKKLGVVTKLIQEEQVQQVMRYKFEKELNCLQGLQFGRLRLCCAKIRAGGYCRWAVTECPYHQRKPIIPPKYIRNQMAHALKEELKSQGWTFVDDDEQNRTNDMNLTHTFKKPVYIGIQQIRANLSMPVDIFIGKSSVQTNIYVFKVNEKHHKDEPVKFIDFSKDGYTRSNRKKASNNLKDTHQAKERYQELVNLECR